MQLTSPWLLVAASLVTLGALAGVIVAWPRLRGRGWPGRVVGILLVEALALTTAAIEINRAGDFYPSWSSLAAGAPKQHIAPTRPPALAGALAGHAASGSLTGYVLRWQPAGWTTWGLAAAPTVYLPPAYFRTPGLRLPVLIVMAPAATTGAAVGWDDRTLAQVIRTAPAPACVVVLRPGARISVAHLTAGLTGSLTNDFGVEPHGWLLAAARPVAAPAAALFQAADADVRTLAVEAKVTALTSIFEQLPAPLAPPVTVEQVGRRGT